MAKRFGAKDNETEGIARREPFEFGVSTSSGVVVHTFMAVLGKLHAGGLIAALLAAQRQDVTAAAEAYYRTIAKMIDNNDGIPSGWEPSPLPQDPNDDRPASFRVPWGAQKGEILPMTKAAEYLDAEVHSSRRRWFDLMEHDDEAVVEFDDLTELFEWLIAQSTEKASAASS